jgi:hypothetical protein
MASFFSLLKRTYNVSLLESPTLLLSIRYYCLQALNPPSSPTTVSPIKFGILGAANISPRALILPASNHPETVVYAVAARDNKKAAAFGKKHSIGKVYSGPTGYQRGYVLLHISLTIWRAITFRIIG